MSLVPPKMIVVGFEKKEQASAFMSFIPECKLVYAMHLLTRQQNMVLANDFQSNMTVGASGVIWLHCGNNNKHKVTSWLVLGTNTTWLG